jgi:hypothetical protein
MDYFYRLRKVYSDENFDFDGVTSSKVALALLLMMNLDLGDALF